MKYLSEFPEVPFQEFKKSMKSEDCGSIFGSQEKLNKYGTSVRQFFQFLQHMIIIYFILSLLVIYPMIKNYNGNGFEGKQLEMEDSLIQKLSIGNQDKVILEQVRKDASEQLEKEIMERNKQTVLEYSRIEESYSFQIFDFIFSMVFLILAFVSKYLLTKSEKKNRVKYRAIDDYTIRVQGLEQIKIQKINSETVKDFFVRKFDVNPIQVIFFRDYNDSLRDLKDQKNNIFKIINIVLNKLKSNKIQKYEEFESDKVEINEYIKEIENKQKFIDKKNPFEFPIEKSSNHDKFKIKYAIVVLQTIKDKYKVQQFQEKIQKNIYWNDLLNWNSLSLKFNLFNPENINQTNLDLKKQRVKRIVSLFIINSILVIVLFGILNIVKVIFIEIYSLENILYRNLYQKLLSFTMAMTSLGINYFLEKFVKSIRFKYLSNQLVMTLELQFYFNQINSIGIPNLKMDHLSLKEAPRDWYFQNVAVVLESLIFIMLMNIFKFDFFGMTTRLIEFVNFLKRCFCCKRKQRQGIYKDHIPLNFSITDQYANTLNIITLTIFFAPGIPLMIPFGFIYLVSQYYSTNYLLFKLCKIPQVSDQSLFKINSSFFTNIIIMHLIYALFVYCHPSIFPPKNVDFSFNVTSDMVSSNPYKNIEIVYNDIGSNISETGTYLIILTSILFLFLFKQLSNLGNKFYFMRKKIKILDRDIFIHNQENKIEESKVFTQNLKEMEKYQVVAKIMNSEMSIINIAKMFQEFFKTSQDISSYEFKLLLRILEEVKNPQFGAESQKKYYKELGFPYYFQYFMKIIYKELDDIITINQSYQHNQKIQQKIEKNYSQSEEARYQFEAERNRREEFRKISKIKKQYKNNFEFMGNIANIIPDTGISIRFYDCEAIVESILQTKEQKVHQQQLIDKRNLQVQMKKQNKQFLKKLKQIKEFQQQFQQQKLEQLQNQSKMSQLQQELRDQEYFEKLKFLQQQTLLKLQKPSFQRINQKEEDLIDDIGQLIAITNEYTPYIKSLPHILKFAKTGLIKHFNNKETNDSIEQIYQTIKSEIILSIEKIIIIFEKKMSRLEQLLNIKRMKNNNCQNQSQEQKVLPIKKRHKKKRSNDRIGTQSFTEIDLPDLKCGVIRQKPAITVGDTQADDEEDTIIKKNQEYRENKNKNEGKEILKEQKRFISKGRRSKNKEELSIRTNSSEVQSDILLSVRSQKSIVRNDEILSVVSQVSQANIDELLSVRSKESEV